METEHVHGGAFQIARKLFESDLWENKPATWKVIWIYILGNVNHKQNGLFERGEGFFNFAKDLRKIGNDITEDMVKKFCVYARNQSMISTERSTRGMRIKVLNYNKYQTMGSYVRTTIGTSLAREEHERSTPINKNDKNEKKDTYLPFVGEYEITSVSEVLVLWNAYPNWKATGQRSAPRNPSVVQNLLPLAKLTPDLKAGIIRKRSKYSLEEMETAIKAYATEIANRSKDDKGFYLHRFTAYEFFIYKQTFERYANR